jgi:hypothetical protein
LGFEPLEGRALLAIADAGPPTYQVDEGASKILMGSASGQVTGPLIFEWDLDGDGVFETPGQSVTFSAAGLDGLGSKTVTLRLDDGGVISTDTAVVVINNASPSASFSISEPWEEGTPIAVTSVVSDPAGTSDTVTVGWKVFKNNSFIKNGGNAPSFTFTPDDQGSFRIELTADDEDGGQTFVSQTIDVKNAAPTITQFSTPSNATLGSKVELSALASDPGVSDVLTYSWSISAPGFGPIPRTGTQASFVTLLEGPHTVTLTVNDGQGGIFSLSAEMNVGKFKV